MRFSTLLLATLAAGFAAPASAIVINENQFATDGGQIANIPATIATGLAPLQAASRADPFHVVGELGPCSATWIGDSDGFSWFLTSAQCVSDRGTPAQAVVMQFVAWNGTVIADGQGWRYLPPARINPTSGLPLAATDIALVKLPWKATLRNAAGQAVAPARLYDGGLYELNRQVTFIGHGTWGVGTQQNSHWTATDGGRRLLGRSIISAYRDAEHTLVAGYIGKGATARGARTSTGDEGAPWMQDQVNAWYVVGVTHGNSNTQSTATRVAPYAAWIRDVFPKASFYSDPMKLTEVTPFVSRADAQLAWYVPAGQPGVSAQPDEILTSGTGFVEILVNAMNDATSTMHTVRLRATRAAGRALEIRFERADNPLPAGRYRAIFAVDAKTGDTPKKHIGIELDIDGGLAARVTRSAGYQSPNLSVPHTQYGNVFFVVPVQEGASGPTEGVWHGNNAHSQISVQVTKDGESEPVTMILRGDRDARCVGERFAMNNAQPCIASGVVLRTSVLHVSYNAADNPGLAPGRYRGFAYIEAVAWGDPFRKGIALDVDVDTN